MISLNVKHHLRMAFIFLAAVFLLPACTEEESTPFNGSILLYYATRNTGEALTTGIYELRDGQNEPQLLWSIPIKLNEWDPGWSPRPTVSADGTHAYLPGNETDAIINLQTGELRFLQSLNTDDWHRAAFSPDNRHLAFIPREENGLYVLDLGRQTLDDAWLLIQRGNCAAYIGCDSRVCLPMNDPLWLDGQTILIQHDRELFNFAYDFPETTGGCSAGSFDKEYSAIHLDATVSGITFAGGNLNETRDNQTRVVVKKWILEQPTEVMWWNPADLARQTIHDFYLPSGVEYSLSNDGRFLLQYDEVEWKILDMYTGGETIIPVEKSLFSGDSLSDIQGCAWSPDGLQAACIGDHPGKGFELALISGTDLTIQTLLEWEDVNQAFGYGWYVLTWKP